MKTIGILGGMAWPSTVDYYKIINQYIGEKLGGNNSAQIIIHSPNFANIEEMQNLGKWEEMGELLGNNARTHLSGADFIIIATNTMHKVASIIEDITKKPLLHIADATANTILKTNINKVALLGTRFTMMEDFYKNKLRNHNIETIIPNYQDIKTINNIIYSQLVKGIVSEQAKEDLTHIIKNLVISEGIEGAILGCTELPLLYPNKDRIDNIHLFKTADIHAIAAAKFALE